jgi:putative membrane protein
MENRQETNTHEGKGHIILRDHLAAHRTDLANDRTFLAYIRTALTFAVVGVTFIRFFGNRLIEIIGWIFIPIGIYVFIKGWLQFKKTKKAIKEEERNPPDISDI